YGIVLDPQGNPWVALLRTNMVAKIDPKTLAVTRLEQGDPKARSRRIEVTSDGMVWTGDEARGFLIRIDPSTGATREWQVPGGAGARPYVLTKDGQGRLWFSETGPEKRLVGFDPKTEQFFANIAVSGTIRHMHFDKASGTLWFGTDANEIGRIVTGMTTSCGGMLTGPSCSCSPRRRRWWWSDGRVAPRPPCTRPTPGPHTWRRMPRARLRDSRADSVSSRATRVTSMARSTRGPSA